MHQIEIIKVGNSNGTYWALCKNSKEDFAILTTSDLREIGTTEISNSLFESLFWLPFVEIEDLDLSIVDSSPGYSRNTVLSFGMYKDYELGIVYMFDAHYIDWCINNIEDFFINDLDELEKFGILRYNPGYQTYRQLKVAEFSPIIISFESVQDVAREVGMACTIWKLADSTKRLNEQKIRNHR